MCPFALLLYLVGGVKLAHTLGHDLPPNFFFNTFASTSGGEAPRLAAASIERSRDGHEPDATELQHGI